MAVDKLKDCFGSRGFRMASQCLQAHIPTQEPWPCSLPLLPHREENNTGVVESPETAECFYYYLYLKIQTLQIGNNTFNALPTINLLEEWARKESEQNL